MESEKARAKRLMNNYNLTIEESDRIDAYQNNVCWVCGRPEPVAGRRLATDHSHRTGLVRGRLCSRCNPILGKLENAFVRLGMHKIPGINFVHIVERIAAYVRNPPAVAALGREVFGYAGKVGTKKQRKLLAKQAKMTVPSRPLIPACKGKK
jgi:hypothetical protein